MTMPSIGAVMTVCSRLTSAVWSCDFACTSAASDERICASADSHVHVGRLELGSWQQILVEERLGAVELLLGVGEGDFQAFQIRFRSRDVRALLLDLGVEDRRVEPRDHLPLLHDELKSA